jgi:hypothetical protein
VLFYWAYVVLCVNVVILWKKIELQQKALRKKFKDKTEDCQWYIHVLESFKPLDYGIVLWAMYEVIFSETAQWNVLKIASGKHPLLQASGKSSFFGWHHANEKHPIISNFWNDTVTCTWELRARS